MHSHFSKLNWWRHPMNAQCCSVRLKRYALREAFEVTNSMFSMSAAGGLTVFSSEAQPERFSREAI